MKQSIKNSGEENLPHKNDPLSKTETFKHPFESELTKKESHDKHIRKLSKLVQNGKITLFELSFLVAPRFSALLEILQTALLQSVSFEDCKLSK